MINPNIPFSSPNNNPVVNRDAIMQILKAQARGGATVEPSNVIDMENLPILSGGGSADLVFEVRRDEGGSDERHSIAVLSGIAVKGRKISADASVYDPKFNLLEEGKIKFKLPRKDTPDANTVKLRLYKSLENISEYHDAFDKKRTIAATILGTAVVAGTAIWVVTHKSKS